MAKSLFAGSRWNPHLSPSAHFRYRCTNVEESYRVGGG